MHNFTSDSAPNHAPADTARAPTADDAPPLRRAYSADLRTHWLVMDERPRPCFTPRLMSALRAAFTDIAAEADHHRHDSAPIHAVLRSSRPGVFSLGGDLQLFADAIERGDRERLRRYALDAIDLVLWGEETDDAPVCTVALVEGDALAGGLEAARSCHLLVAERRARFGLPESGFGLFPGMGAYALLSRYGGHALAERMIVSGARYTAQQMLDAGIVDVLADDGEGESLVRSLITERVKHPAATRCVRELRRSCGSQSIDILPLRRNAALWVESALSLDPRALRRMRRLSAPGITPGITPSTNPHNARSAPPAASNSAAPQGDAGDAP